MIIESHKKELIFDYTHNINFIKSIDANYYVMMNDDLYVKENWLNALIETTKQDEKIGIVGGLYFFPDGKVQHAGGMNRFIFNKFFNLTPKQAGPALYKQRDCPFIQGALQLITKKCIDTIGWYDDQTFSLICSDVEYCFRAWYNNFRVVYQPKCIAVHEEKLSRNRIDPSEEVLKLEHLFKTKYANIYSIVKKSQEEYDNVN